MLPLPTLQKVRIGLVFSLCMVVLGHVSLVAPVHAQSVVLERFQSLQDSIAATNTLSASSEADLVFGTSPSALANLRSMIPVVLYGDTVELTEPTRSSVIAIGQSVTINAPIAQDLYVMAFDLTVNDQVFGTIAAVTTRAQITVPNRLELHTPFSIGKILWLQYIQPFSQAVMEERAQRAEERARQEQLEAEQQRLMEESQQEEQPTEETPQQTVMGGFGWFDNTPPSSGSDRGGRVQRWSLVQPVQAQETSDQAPVSPADEQASAPATATSLSQVDWDPVVAFGRSALTTLVVMLLLVVGVPGFSRVVTESLVNHPLASLGWGFIILIIVPVLAVALLFTGLGWLLSLVLFTAYGLGILLATPLVALALGSVISAKLISRSGKTVARLLSHKVGQAMLGVLVVSVLTQLPVVGGWMSFFILLAGLGGGVLWLRSNQVSA